MAEIKESDNYWVQEKSPNRLFKSFSWIKIDHTSKMWITINDEKSILTFEYEFRGYFMLETCRVGNSTWNTLYKKTKETKPQKENSKEKVKEWRQVGKVSAGHQSTMLPVKWAKHPRF